MSDTRRTAKLKDKKKKKLSLYALVYIYTDMTELKKTPREIDWLIKQGVDTIKGLINGHNVNK